jgi:hypothetical protein
MKLQLILIVIISVAGSVHAQETRLRESPNDEPQSVTNDDRGRAFIITRDTPPVLAAPHGKVTIEPQQNSIFLGRGWESESMRAREPELANLLSDIRGQIQLSAPDQRRMKNFFAATASQEKLVDIGSSHVISDLEIQSMLRAMLKDNSLQRTNTGTIYVIYLDPAMRSTLGGMIAGKHYLAYHNYFNTSGMKIHYVVIPFEANQKTAYRIALRAFLSAVFNPGDES